MNHSQAISHVSTELQFNVSETVSATIIRVDVTLMMAAEAISETVDCNSVLSWLIAQEDYISRTGKV
jgi:hypothetical protein